LGRGVGRRSELKLAFLLGPVVGTISAQMLRMIWRAYTCIRIFSLSLSCSQVHAASANEVKFHDIGWHGHLSLQFTSITSRRRGGKRQGQAHTQRHDRIKESALLLVRPRDGERERARKLAPEEGFDLTEVTVSALPLSPTMQALHKPGSDPSVVKCT
jgi:hypothetical protein